MPHCTSTTGTEVKFIDVSEKPALGTEDESIGVLKSLLAPHGVKRAAGPGNNIEKEINNNGLWTISVDGSGCWLVPGNTVSIGPPGPPLDHHIPFLRNNHFNRPPF